MDSSAQNFTILDQNGVIICERFEPDLTMYKFTMLIDWDSTKTI